LLKYIVHVIRFIINRNDWQLWNCPFKLPTLVYYYLHACIQEGFKWNIFTFSDQQTETYTSNMTKHYNITYFCRHYILFGFFNTNFCRILLIISSMTKLLNAQSTIFQHLWLSMLYCTVYVLNTSNQINFTYTNIIQWRWRTNRKPQQWVLFSEYKHEILVCGEILSKAHKPKAC